MSRKLALLIASDVYDDTNYSTLFAPKRDVEALARVLRRADIGGFDEVKTLLAGQADTVRMEIEDFFGGKKPDDLLLLYFSGHGDLTGRGLLHLIVQNTQQRLLGSTAISSSFVKDVMDASRSKRQVLMLDCCHSGAFTRGAKGGLLDGQQMAMQFEGRGRFILTAAGATQSAWEGDEGTGEGGGLSVFTKYIVRGLETGEADLDGDRWITVDELYQYLYERVSDELHGQTPGKWVENQQGSMALARSVHPAKFQAKHLFQDKLQSELQQEPSSFQVNYDKLRTRALVTTSHQVVLLGVAAGVITGEMLEVLREALNDVKQVSQQFQDKEFLMLRGIWFDDKRNTTTLYIDLIHDWSIRPALTVKQIGEEFYDGRYYYGSRQVKVELSIIEAWVLSGDFLATSNEYYKRIPWYMPSSMI